MRKGKPLTQFNIRAAEPGDAEAIKNLAVVNNMFAAEEISFFDELLAGFFNDSLEGHQWLVATGYDPSAILAAAYFAPEPFADRMWNLYFIATDPDQHGSGVGTELIEHVESELRSSGEDVARTLIVDTSSLPEYEQARGFYLRRGFVEEARVRDFNGPGDDKVTFWKSLVN